MSKFSKGWSVTCPKCDKEISQNDFTCSNCGKGHAYADVIKPRNIVNVFFGCNNCGDSMPYLNHACGCNIRAVAEENFKNKNKNETCFVATAVYGNVDFQNVKILRLFRDNVLAKTNSGKSFIRWSLLQK